MAPYPLPHTPSPNPIFPYTVAQASSPCLNSNKCRVGTAHHITCSKLKPETMERREFIWNLGMGLAAAWTIGRLSWPMALEAADRPLFLALLADAHLHNGDPNHAEAQALARAVAEIKALKPAPHLVFFAGDLVHDGNPMALGLGAEILSDLPMPLLAVRGERDGCAGQGGPGRQIFHNGPFVYNYEGINLLGLDTQWQTTPDGPGFALGGDQHRWLAQAMAPARPCRAPHGSVPRPPDPHPPRLGPMDHGQRPFTGPAFPVRKRHLPPRSRASQ